MWFIIILLLCLLFFKHRTEEPFTTDNVIFITLTNNGYIDYTLNCYKSMNNLNMNLHSYVIGKEAYDKLKGRERTLLPSNDTEFSEFRKGNWHNITKQKFKIIHDNLKHYKYVCFTDGDIVYKKNVIDYCFEHIGGNDILIQNDTLDDDDHSNLCSGFMFIRSNDKTKRLFNPTIATKDAKEGWGDQMYINSIKEKLKYKMLPLNLFPNGQYYYKYQPKSYLIHFNWIVGHKKKDKMKSYGYWFI